MADDQYIVNQALGHLGETETDDLNPATMRQNAKKVVRHLDQAKDAVLEKHGWLCALTYVDLTPSGLPRNWKYATVYQLPGNFIRLWTVDGVAGSAFGPGRWERGSMEVGDPPAGVHVIYADGSTTLRVAYVRRVMTSLLTPALVDAVALELAARACRPINGSVEFARELAKAALAKIGDAAAIEAAQEGGQDPEIPDTFAALRQSAW